MAKGRSTKWQSKSGHKNTARGSSDSLSGESIPPRATTLQLTATPLASPPPSHFYNLLERLRSFRDLRLRRQSGRGLRPDRSRSLRLLSGRVGGPAEQRQVACGSVILFFGWPCAWGCIRRRDTDTRLAAWPASTFLTTIVYIAAVGLELAVAHRILGSDE